METKIIAAIENDYKEKFGIPRQSGLAASVVSRIVFEPEFRDRNAVRGIEEYSHLWLIWQFSENVDKGWSPTVRPPKLGGNVRMGVFATRAPFRPNPIGLSCVELDRVAFEEEGPVLYVKGADLMNGTPILDIKPYIPYTDSYPDARYVFAKEALEKKVEVKIGAEWASYFTKEQIEALIQILSEDPKPGYQKEEGRMYGMEFGEWNVKFIYQGNTILVCKVEAGKKRRNLLKRKEQE